MEQPDQATMEWVRDQLGEVTFLLQFAHEHGYSRLWRIRASSGNYWLKMHAFQVKWAGEVHALTHWTPRLGLTPRVVAFRSNSRAVILSEVEGQPAEEVEMTAAEELRLWNEAGGWLKKLHAIENDWLGTIDPDGQPSGAIPNDATDFVQTTFEQRVRDGREMKLLNTAEIDFVDFGMREWLPSLVGEQPRAIHRDFTPRNWMAGEGGELAAVIDFEHARWDIRAADMNRWWDHDFLRHPALQDAFFDAYGQPSAQLSQQIRVMRLLNAVGGVVWATKVKDFPFAERNREALHRMMAENRT